MKIAVWAVNPFELETRPSPIVIEELRKWAEASDLKIQPVHVLCAPSADIPSEERGSWVKRYVEAMETEVAGYLKGMDLPEVLAPKVLAQPPGSTHCAVDALIQYAHDVDAAWILVSSKGRSGLRRMALGSFAENLLLKSSLPVWVFGHGAPPFGTLERILFATDFSDFSKAAFKRVVQQASLLGASVTLFNCINLPDMMASGGAMGMFNAFPVDVYLKSETEWARDRATAWILYAREMGVTVSLVVKQVVPSIASAIVGEAGLAGAGIIALASRSGAVGAAFLGSHARQVIRQSECPVWVFGPKWSQDLAEPTEACPAANLA